MPDDVTGARKGDYLILGTLGAGGMGKVYKVRNTLSDRVEAMKVLLPDLSEQQDLADRFLREIKVLASLHHPNIAELRTALTIGNQLVMIMEYVEGSTLGSRLQQGPIRYADAVAYFDQVLAALACAHAQHIVHRDIKPANIMLAPHGVVKLMDFGIARSGNDHGLTMTGTTLGSVSYMSPEQVRCEPLDGRSDLYSIGVSLYETITGLRPYVSDNNFEIMQAHLQVPATPPIELKPDLPPALSQLILMAMAKDPDQRFQTADALRAALHSVAPALGEPTPIEAVMEPTFDMTQPPTPRTGAPSSPRPATARPATARSVTARPPVTARPITAQPAAPPPPVPHSPLTPTVPLHGSALPQPHAQVPAAAAAAPASAGNRRGLYVAVGVIGALVMLATVTFGAWRWVHAHFAQQSASDPTTTLAPGASASDPSSVPSQLDAPAPDPGAAVPTPSKPAVVPTAKPRTAAPAATPSPASPRVDASQQGSPPQASAPQQPTPAVKQPDREAEQSTRKTVATVAQLAALEHEELDDLTKRANSADKRITAMQAQGKQPSSDIAACQTRARNDLALAQNALQKGDVQNAQKDMDQADNELSRLEKLLPR
jgi:eukaryotic-like serine/threonine-protein kinase